MFEMFAETHVGLRVECSLLWSYILQSWDILTYFINTSSIKFYDNVFSGFLLLTYGQRDKQNEFDRETDNALAQQNKTGRTVGRQQKLIFIWQVKSEQNSLLVLITVIKRPCVV